MYIIKSQHKYDKHEICLIGHFTSGASAKHRTIGFFWLISLGGLWRKDGTKHVILRKEPILPKKKCYIFDFLTWVLIYKWTSQKNVHNHFFHQIGWKQEFDLLRRALNFPSNLRGLRLDWIFTPRCFVLRFGHRDLVALGSAPEMSFSWRCFG